MAVYSVSGQQNAVTTTLKTAIDISNAATAMRRWKIFDINVSQGGAPASTDTNIQFDWSRYSTAKGTGSAATANPNDPADVATTLVAVTNNSAEPTTTFVSLFNIALNQRAPYRWQTYLGSGAELVMPATASLGGALRALSAGYTGSAGGVIYFQEQ